MDKKKKNNICIQMPTATIKHLKKMSHYLSIERGEDLTFSDLIREAVDRAFPIPERQDGKQEDKS